MSSIQKQLVLRAKQLRIRDLKTQRDISDKTFLSDVFSQWKIYKRFNDQLSIIQRFIRSIWFFIKMRKLKKNRQDPDTATHSVPQYDRFIILEQNRSVAISWSRDFKNDEYTRLRVFLHVFVITHSPEVDEVKFIQKLREMMNHDIFNYIQSLIGNQSFIQFFESTRKTRDEISKGCSTARSMHMYISGLVWILYYLSSKRLPKSWFPNPESNFGFVLEELMSVVGQNIHKEDECRLEMEEPSQSDYFSERCHICGCETIQGNCFNDECMRMRENVCASCRNSIEESNVVEIDGMRLHRDCANHNQQTQHFRNYTECSVCGCSSDDMSFVEGIGLICGGCMSANQ